MGKNNDSTTLRINYSYRPLGSFLIPERVRARAKLLEKVGEVIGDGGEFHLSISNQEKYVKHTDIISGRWVCRVEELDEVTEE